ncbi:hypothetical protein [Solemya velesiana gill symbiont]|uniref:Uncharacterized protein n=1 Tax=Solemya velesiana gill symbiont TaxID=1918948 RepID=A0A1T2KS30_9GAMM|nr:hypothetical protein [Solemya velesiana gill symbiont]OOZ35665.1 hypothetical protein BOW51_10960 [Solemya velesiana gill symbiont]
MSSNCNITDIRNFLPRFGADQLIQQCREKQPIANTHPDELLENLPDVLRSTLDLLLEEFDYQQEISSNQAIVARLLAMTVVRLEDRQHSN